MTRHFVTDVPTSATTDPNDKRHLGVEEHEASARALEAAEQKPAAIQSWHRAAIGHARAGNLPGVIAAIVRAEKLADHRDFAPDLERKSIAADAAPVAEPIERVGDASDGPIEPPIERVGDRPAPDANKPASNTAAAERL